MGIEVTPFVALWMMAFISCLVGIVGNKYLYNEIDVDESDIDSQIPLVNEEDV